MRAEKSRRELRKNMLASCITGGVVMLATNPLDTLKQRYQVSASATLKSRTTLSSFAVDIVRNEGVLRGLWAPGLFSNIACCSISVGVRLGTYPLIRDLVSGGDAPSAGVLMGSGLLSGAAGYFFASPLFYAKNVLQATSGLVSSEGIMVTGSRKGKRPLHRNGASVLVHAVRKNGIFAMWKGCHLLVARGAVMSSAQLSSYDGMKKLLLAKGLCADGPRLHLFASFCASVACVTAVIPFDVVLTNYQAADAISEQKGFRGPAHAAKSLLQNHGFRILFRGWSAMFARMAPSSILSFFLYEQMRRSLDMGYLD